MGLNNFSFYKMLQHLGQTAGDKPAFFTAGKSVTYGQFLDRVDRLASGFQSHGVAKADRVCILAQNSVEFLEVFGACAKTGAIVYPVNWRLSASEVREVIALADPHMLVVGPEHLAQLDEADLSSIPVKVLLGEGEATGFISFGDLYTSPPGPPAEVNSHDPLAIISTAAVAGIPRGAILTHHNFGAVAELFVGTFGLSDRDRFLGVLPFFHIAGLIMAVGIAQAGGATVIMTGFDPAAGARLIDEHQVSLIGTFPPMLEMLLNARKQLGAQWGSLRSCFGILNPPEVIKQFMLEVGAEYWTGYGQTETTGIVTLVNVAEKPGSAGKAVPMLQMRCVNDAGEDVPVGEPGEIAVKGSLVFAGYWRDEDATRYASRFGWHHTGDVGKLDADGYLYFVGRKPEKELIKSGGENIYPGEVEHIIRQLPQVADVCVIGVPDDQWGETVKAVVELVPGESLDAEQLTQAVADRIASYKKPRHIEFVADLPRLANGEIDRAAVKAEYSTI